MHSSQSGSSSERRSEPNPQQIISQPEPKQLQEHGGGRRRNDSNTSCTSSGNETSKDELEEEIIRPDLELNYQGNSLVIDMSRIEWIALAIIVLSVTSTIYLLR